MKDAKRSDEISAVEFKTAFGWVTARATKRGICEIDLGARPRGKGTVAAAAPILERVKREVTEYFEGRRRKFGVPLDLSGLPEFAKSVSIECAAIPYGQTAAYSGLARAVGRPRAARAVGRVMARNPIPILIPCHRVIGADGSLTGFGGGIELKRRLLELERGGTSRGR